MLNEQAGPLRRPSKGSSLVEFALAATLFLSTLFLAFNFFFWTFAKAALLNAVREGTRYAITGKTQPLIGQDNAIRQVVEANSFGLLDASSASSITVSYYAADGSGATASNTAGNFVVVSVVSYAPPTMAPLFGFSMPIRFTVKAIDKTEPFSGAPPTR